MLQKILTLRQGFKKPILNKPSLSQLTGSAHQPTVEEICDTLYLKLWEESLIIPAHTLASLEWGTHLNPRGNEEIATSSLHKCRCP